MILDNHSLKIAHNTIGAYAFYYIVRDALASGKSLSVVRMGDGECTLFKSCLQRVGQDSEFEPITDFTQEWRECMGIEGISSCRLLSRMQEAANSCTYFAPNTNGLVKPNFNVYQYANPRDMYVDNFFVNIWSDDQKADLFKNAGEIIFIHKNRATADAIQKRIKNYFGVWTTYIEMGKWQDAEAVIARAQELTNARLVLFAGGPANKFISPRIAAMGKVVLDIGNATDKWTLQNYTPTETGTN